MLSENHNNSNWRNKLEDENALSAEILSNKNIAWEKLHSRLQQKPRRKKVLRYWMAAACLLPAIVISLMFFIKNEEKAAKNMVIKEKALKPENHMQYLKADTAAADFTIFNRKKKPLKIKLRNNNNTIANADKEHLETNIQKANNELISPLSDSSNKTTIAAAQPKKKLKVVHINELGEPAEELPVTGHNSNLHYFQLKLANQEVYMSNSLTSHNSGVNLLKIKSPTSN